MGALLSKRRYELVALILGVLASALHLWTERQSPTGLSTAGDQIPALARGLQLLEGRATDLKFKVRGPVKPHPDLVVVEIDEKSAQAYGLWPWPRHRFATGLEKLLDAEASVIGLDVSFTDESSDESDIYKTLASQFDAAAGATPPEALAKFREELTRKSADNSDELLAKAFARGGEKIVHGVFPYTQTEAQTFSPERLAQFKALIRPRLLKKYGSTTDTWDPSSTQWWMQEGGQAPLTKFVCDTCSLAHLGFVPDGDGTMRRTPVLARLTDFNGLFPSLALKTAAVHLKSTISIPSGLGQPSQILLLGEKTRKIPFENSFPFVFINHVSAGKDFPVRLSMVDVIEDRFDHKLVKGKAVLIGLTITGSSGDQRVTPFRELEAGVYTHASMLSNILAGSYLTRFGGLPAIEALLVILLSLIIGTLVSRLRSFGLKALVMFGFAAGWLVISYALFLSGTLVATVFPVSTIIATSFSVIFLGYLSTDREKLKMRSTFSRYLGEDVMEEAMKNPEKLNQGEKRDMTVLFSDIRGFTSISERMGPEQLADFIKDYLSPMTQIVFDEKGTLDKYIGDAVMAFWNAPLDQKDHALRACRAAWSMLVKLEELKKKWREAGLPEIDIGVGINSGPMVVGNMGSDVRVDYTVMGDSVNLASRLEGTNKEYETRVIISEGTYEQVKNDAMCRRLGAVRVKGKRKPVGIYELRGIGTASGDLKAGIDGFDAALNAYQAQQWDEAEKQFKAVLALWPEDPPARRYLEEIAEFRLNPPPAGWDGVYTATSK